MKIRGTWQKQNWTDVSSMVESYMKAPDGHRGFLRWLAVWLPTPVSWPGEFHGLYSPQGHKESDKTERL